MDSFTVLALVWLLSAAGTTIVGHVRGRPTGAMTLGILFGPVGILLALVFIPRPLRQESFAMVAHQDAAPLVMAEREVALRRAA
jgi:multisubunit Na+/H+ antiporter MnhB subunit